MRKYEEHAAMVERRNKRRLPEPNASLMESSETTEPRRKRARPGPIERMSPERTHIPTEHPTGNDMSYGMKLTILAKTGSTFPMDETPGGTYDDHNLDMAEWPDYTKFRMTDETPRLKITKEFFEIYRDT